MDNAVGVGATHVLCASAAEAGSAASGATCASAASFDRSSSISRASAFQSQNDRGNSHSRPPILRNFEELVLGFIDSYDIEQRRILQHLLKVYICLHDLHSFAPSESHVEKNHGILF